MRKNKLSRSPTTSSKRPKEETTSLRVPSYEASFENSPCCCFTLDEAGYIRLINRAARQCLGFSSGLTGRLIDYLTDESSKVVCDAYEHVKKSHDVVGLKIQVKRDDLPALSVLLKLSPILSGEGVLLGSQGAFFDGIQHAFDGSSASQNVDEAAAQKVKYEVLSDISHEVRTPLNAIIGMADLLARTDLNSQQQIFLSYLKAASARLLAFINETIR